MEREALLGNVDGQCHILVITRDDMCHGIVNHLLVALLLTLAPVLHAQAPAPPAWAFPIKPASTAPVPTDSANNRFIGPDWHPAEHAPPPDPILHGRQPGVWACAYCHRADGSGGPENASLAGLSVAYMQRQLQDFRSGARTGSEPKRLPAVFMAQVARAATDSELVAALQYLAAQPLPKRIAIVETATVPVTRNAGWVLTVAPGDATEQLGQRIIEVPNDLEIFERRDSHARFTAWVPVGSIAKGQALVASLNCARCHGPALLGLDPAPAIAGRSPTYIVRQLYDFKTGTRAGAASAPMKLVAEQLSLDDMIAAAAYLASLLP